MHAADKIARSAIGQLTQSKEKQVINPFPQGVALHKKCHDGVTYFSYLDRWDKLMLFRPIIPGGFAQVHPKVDLNTTRIAATKGLFNSMLRL